MSNKSLQNTIPKKLRFWIKWMPIKILHLDILSWLSGRRANERKYKTRKLQNFWLKNDNFLSVMHTARAEPYSNLSQILSNGGDRLSFILSLLEYLFSCLLLIFAKTWRWRKAKEGEQRIYELLKKFKERTKHSHKNP